MGRTPESEIAEELGAISAIITKAGPEGIQSPSIATELLKSTGREIAPRTLRRRLEELVRQREIVQHGQKRGARYRRPEISGAEPQIDPAEIPLSAEGTRQQDLVRLPIAQREPTGYNPEWLRNYRPNHTSYLTKPIRARLLELGRTTAEERPAGTFARDILGRLLIDLSWASSKLEGNTYTRLDTQNLIEFGQRAEGKDAQETQMILNHKRAIELVVDESGFAGSTRRTVLNLHSALSENLLADPANEGRLREQAVSISGSVYTPSAIPAVIQESFDRILETYEAISDPFEQSFFLMVHIPYLQPFIDVNKRTSRLAANIPLIRGNLSPLSFVDVPEGAYFEGTLAVYEQRKIELLRDVYIWAYERSRARYVVARDAVVQPDPIRVRHREALHDVVHETVGAVRPAEPRRLGEWAASHGIPEADQPAFVNAAMLLLLGLSEGTIDRYRLSAGQFRTWRSQAATRGDPQPTPYTKASR